MTPSGRPQAGWRTGHPIWCATAREHPNWPIAQYGSGACPGPRPTAMYRRSARCLPGGRATPQPQDGTGGQSRFERSVPDMHKMPIYLL